MDSEARHMYFDRVGHFSQSGFLNTSYSSAYGGPRNAVSSWAKDRAKRNGGDAFIGERGESVY